MALLRDIRDASCRFDPIVVPSHPFLRLMIFPLCLSIFVLNFCSSLPVYTHAQAMAVQVVAAAAAAATPSQPSTRQRIAPPPPQQQPHQHLAQTVYAATCAQPLRRARCPGTSYKWCPRIIGPLLVWAVMGVTAGERGSTARVLCEQPCAGPRTGIPQCHSCLFGCF